MKKNQTTKPANIIAGISEINKSHKSEMKRIAKEMADFFDTNFTVTDLIVWHIKACDLLFYFQYKTTEIQKTGPEFLAGFGYTFIPGLLNAKSITERKIVLEKELPLLFAGCSNVKKALCDINKAFLLSYEILGYDDKDVFEFMKHTGCFMALTEMNSDYEHLENKEYERKAKLKAA